MVVYSYFGFVDSLDDSWGYKAIKYVYVPGWMFINGFLARVELLLGFTRGYVYGLELLVVACSGLCFGSLVVQLPRQCCPCVCIK